MTWTAKSLAQLCSPRRELEEPSADGMNRYVGLEHVDPGWITIRRWGSDREVRSTKNRFHRGDVLYGKLRPYLDKAALAEWDGVCSTDILTLEPDPAEADPWFLTLLLHTQTFLDHAIATTSGVNHPRTSWQEISRFSGAVPPVPEQKAIAGVLAKIQGAVEVEDRRIAALKELKAATMAKVFREGLNGEALAETVAGPLPLTWQLQPIGGLLKLSSGKKRPADLAPEPSDTKRFPVFGGNGIMGFADDHMTEHQAIVIGRVGAYCGEVYLAPANAWVTDNALFNPEPLAEDVVPRFLAVALRQLRLNQYRRMGAQPLITQGTICPLLVPLPKRDEQVAIAAVDATLADRIATATARHRTLRDLFAATLQQLMTGQVHVTPLISPEEVPDA